MLRYVKNGLEWLNFELFSECPGLIHGVFLRHGGVSQGAFHSLNFGFTQGDDAKKVALNREKAAKILGVNHFTNLYQEHTTKVIEAKLGIKNKGDGLITDQIGLGLLILHADCQAAIFYDPIHHALANVHCGWRGSVGNIYKETVDKMRTQYGTSPSNLLVGISPSLGPFAAEFSHYKKELPEAFWDFQIKPTYFDFWEISRWQLKKLGILDHHIEIASMCTYFLTEDFFSYRREKRSGRHGTFAMLKTRSSG